MLRAGYFHPFSSRIAASVVGIDNDKEGQRSGYQLPLVAGQNSIKIGFKTEIKRIIGVSTGFAKTRFRYITINIHSNKQQTSKLHKLTKY
jgi:hypothetical protein